MRFTIERAVLLKALNHVQSVVERRNTIPVLSNILFRAEGEEIRLTATDLDIEMVETATADIAQPGATTLPAHMMYDIVRKLPDGAQLEIEQGPDETRLTVRSSRAQFSLQVLPVSEFPDLSSGDMTHKFTLGAGDLKRLIEKTRFAISTEETRYYLNGIYLHEVKAGGGSLLRAVATDGHRLAQVQLELPKGAESLPGVIVPRKAVFELHKLLEDEKAEIAVSLSQSKIRFEAGSVVLTSKLIDSTFPDYERVIPKSNDKVLEVDCRLFAEAVDRVSTVSSEKGRAVKLALEEGLLTLSVNNPDSGSAQEELPVDYKADAMEIGFNAKYLLDVAGQLEDEKARFLLADAGSPSLIQQIGDDTALYVLMPMRV